MGVVDRHDGRHRFGWRRWGGIGRIRRHRRVRRRRLGCRCVCGDRARCKRRSNTLFCDEQDHSFGG